MLFYDLHEDTRPEPNGRSYGMYVHDSGELRSYGVAGDNLISINNDHPTYPDTGSYSYAHPLHDVWLVSDGGHHVSPVIIVAIKPSFITGAFYCRLGLVQLKKVAK